MEAELEMAGWEKEDAPRSKDPHQEAIPSLADIDVDLETAGWDL